MTIAFGSNGCEQRNLDKEYFEIIAQKHGDKIVSEFGSADKVIYISCCVSKHADKEAFDSIMVLNSLAPGRVYVYGCYSGIHKEQLLGLGITSFTVREKANFIREMGWTEDVPYPVLCKNDSPIDDLQHENARERFDAAKKGKKIIISEGCLNSCSYCVVRYSTGKLKSKSIVSIIDEYEKNVIDDEKIMLMGGDTGAYGLDIGTNLPQLLYALGQSCVRANIFLHDLNIRWMKNYLNEFCDTIARWNNVKGITLPIQSGSNNVLKSMQRHYDKQDIRKCFYQLHSVLPDMIIGTHVIVGFPGESEDDFRETLNVLRDINPDFLSCFPYSEHAAAMASKIYPKVGEDAVNKRVALIKDAFGEVAKIYP